MELLLSSAALPDGSLADLRRAVHRRRLTGLELAVGAGHAHQVDAACEAARAPDAQAPPLPQEGPPIHWLVLPPDVSVAQVLYWGRCAHLLRAGLVVHHPINESLAGVPLALLHGSDPEAARRAAAWAHSRAAHTCWQVEPGPCDETRLTDVLDATAPCLAHVRLLGAGPEAQDEQAGTLGTGALMSRLALRGYAGTIALAPSGSGREDAWRAWLFERRGWGCGTAAQKKAARAS